MRDAFKWACGVVFVLLLLLVLSFSVYLMVNAESENVKLINTLVGQRRFDETIPLRVANSQLRIGMAQGFLTLLVVAVTAYYAWQTRLLVKASQPTKDAELHIREERLRAEEVALETQKALAELRALQQEIAALPRPRWWWFR